MKKYKILASDLINSIDSYWGEDFYGDICIAGVNVKFTLITLQDADIASNAENNVIRMAMSDIDPYTEILEQFNVDIDEDDLWEDLKEDALGSYDLLCQFAMAERFRKTLRTDGKITMLVEILSPYGIEEWGWNIKNKMDFYDFKELCDNGQIEIQYDISDAEYAQFKQNAQSILDRLACEKENMEDDEE